MPIEIDWNHEAIKSAMKGRKGTFQTWRRTDLNSDNFKTSMKGGPDWKKTAMRITVNKTDNKFISIQKAEKISRPQEHSIIKGGKRDIYTILVYKGES